MEDLKAIAAHGETGLFGRVRLGVLPTIGPYLLPRCTKPMHSRFPDLRLSINDAATDRLASMLEQGLLEVCEEESMRDILDRYLNYNAHAGSYT